MGGARLLLAPRGTGAACGGHTRCDAQGVPRHGPRGGLGAPGVGGAGSGGVYERGRSRLALRPRLPRELLPSRDWLKHSIASIEEAKIWGPNGVDGTMHFQKHQQNGADGYWEKTLTRTRTPTRRSGCCLQTTTPCSGRVLRG